MASEKRDLYRGKAVIMGVVLIGVEDWKDWERRKLIGPDVHNAFKIVYDVAEGDANGKRHDVEVEISHSELTGKMLEYYAREDGVTPTQIDVALRTLVGQGFLAKGATECDLMNALDDGLIGREVTIRAYEEKSEKTGKFYPRCVFASGKARITGADKAARLAAFLSGKPAPARTDSVPAPSAAAIPAPIDDDGDMPF